MVIIFSINNEYLNMFCFFNSFLVDYCFPLFSYLFTSFLVNYKAFTDPMENVVFDKEKEFQ